jgi:hypothetical protein
MLNAYHSAAGLERVLLGLAIAVLLRFALVESGAADSGNPFHAMGLIGDIAIDEKVTVLACEQNVASQLGRQICPFSGRDRIISALSRTGDARRVIALLAEEQGIIAALSTRACRLRR